MPVDRYGTELVPYSCSLLLYDSFVSTKTAGLVQARVDVHVAQDLSAL